MTSPEDLLQVACCGAEWLTYRAGGLNRYADALARSLAVKGVEQRWLVMGDEDIDVSPGLRVKAVASPRDSLLARWRGMRSAWESHPMPHLATSHFALYAYPLRKQLGRIPHVVHFHGPWADESGAEGASKLAAFAKRRLEKIVYRDADRFVVLSEAFRDILCDRYSAQADKVRVIPGGVDLGRFTATDTRVESRRRLGWEVDRPTILCVRRLVRRMGLEALVAAMQSVIERSPDALLLIAGKGPIQDELQSRIATAGLTASVRLLGFVPDEDLPLAYRAADLSIVPTETLEGFGLIIPESLAAGTPALVTPIGGMPEVVRDLSPDLVLRDSSSDAIAEGLVAALSGEMRLPSSDDCSSYARERFDWNQIAEKVLAVYQEAIEAHG